MAGKSTFPLLAAAGVAAVVLSKSKKKKAAKKKEEEFPQWMEKPEGGNIGDLETSPEGKAKMVFDSECQAFDDKLRADAHNAYITGTFHTLTKSGVRNAERIVMAMLEDQAPHCPWGDPASYTPLMQGVHDQLLGAVHEYAKNQGVALS